MEQVVSLDELPFDKAKIEIIRIFLADRGFEEYEMNTPDEGIHRSADSNRYDFSIVIDATKIANFLGLVTARICVYCKAVSMSGALSVRNDRHTTVDFRIGEGDEDSPLYRDYREKLCKIGFDLADIILRTFPII